MDLNNLDYFISIAEEQNLSKAAARVFITQPALSHYLSRLERSLGEKLFVRHKNNALELTDIGRKFLESLKKIKDTRQEFLNWLDDHKNHAAQTLRVGITGERDIQVIEPILRELRRVCPLLHLEVVENTTAELERMLLNNDIDIGYYSLEEPNPKTQYIPINSGEVTLILHKKHRLSHYGSKDPAQTNKRVPLSIVGETPVIVIRQGTRLRSAMERYFEETGFTPQIKTETNSSYSTCALVATEFGVGLGPDYIKYESDNVSYVALSPPFLYSTGIFYKKSDYLTHTLQALIEIASNYVK